MAIAFFASLAIITVLFAAIFKVLPDARIEWRDVWIGAGITALFFSIGKYSALHARAEKLPGGDTVARWAHGTADKMQATADYVRGHDLGDMVADVKTFTRKHPGASLLTAAVLGFFITRAFRRED